MTAKGSTAAGKVSGIIVTSQEREVSLHTLILLKVFQGSLNQNKEARLQPALTNPDTQKMQANEQNSCSLSAAWMDRNAR